MNQRIAISTECVADMPMAILEEREIALVYFDIQTNKGLFRDTQEIDAVNVIDYMKGGYNKATSVAPSPSTYADHFMDLLKGYDEVIHISISSKVSQGYKNASIGRTKMGLEGNRVHIIDSKQLSGGQALLVLKACDMLKEKRSLKEIIREVEFLADKVSTSFMTDSLEYLSYNGRVSKKAMELCKRLRVHAVLAMKDGSLELDSVHIGTYDNCARKYLKRALGNSNNIDKERSFFIQAGCSAENVARFKKYVKNHVKFDNLIENSASATVSCNCGPGAFGIIYIRK